ncbi:ASCH domain-containing protein [Streptomyces triticagri]|uniref:ASCH domain-containing protein n=1 Tax=Streptomyces triticagri TaxID=2293568 RepID=A0A372M8M7_9ACTN|nr:ASCH domain-containing protein [Streptomyces triticagri]RFU87308.1 ASCH domain-containing protein [Streptomyces triticagri]
MTIPETGPTSTPTSVPTSGADDLPPFELAFPGPLRDRLVAAVLSGAKTTTTSLHAAYGPDEPLPQAGERCALIDSAGRAVAVVETTEVRVLPLGDIDLRHAVDEGEGHTTVARWRSDHEEFWLGPESLAAIGDQDFTLDDSSLVVTERFRVTERLG